MSARSTETGMTLVELVLVLVLVGALAAVVVPRLGLLGGIRADGWREQAAAGLRLAAATAVGHRRLVCAEFAADGQLSLTMAPANPAGACSAAVSLTGPDGSAQFAGAAGTAVTVDPPGLLLFQPDGRVIRPGFGTVNRTIRATGVADIVVYGESGHVE